MSIHFLWGDEDFLIERTISKIKKEVLKGDINELNYKSVDSPSFPLFSELIRTNPMMFGDIVILIKCQKYFLATKNKVELDDKQTAQLIEGFKNVSEKVHLILVCQTPRGENKKPDSRKKLYKELQKIANIQEFPSYKNYEEYKLIPIIKKLAKELEINIQENACSMLIQITGSSLRDLYSQLEKLKLYAYPDTTITSDMVQEIATSYYDVFSAVDDIIKKDYISALNTISNILEKEHYLLSYSRIQTMINNLIKTKIYSNTMSSYDISIKIGQNKYKVEKNIEKLAKIPLEELVRLKINLNLMDYLIKSGTVNEPLTCYEMAFMSNNLGENIC